MPSTLSRIISKAATITCRSRALSGLAPVSGRQSGQRHRPSSAIRPTGYD
jgi:hypothetical protein